MSLRDRLLNGEDCMALVGLGYVGLPLAVLFAQKVKVIGFDTNEEKIARYQQGFDPTHEVGDDQIRQSGVVFTCKEEDLRKASLFIIAVPTPVNQDKLPDLSAVMEASKMVGRNLSEDSVVIYESTVYPGVTEEICIPVLEETSGMMCGVGFRVGYSPERVNPGDQVHRLENIVKIVSGMDHATRDEIAAVYELVIEAGIYRASSIKVAEAAKVAENSQRDLNIAFMNELAMVFDRLGLDTMQVVEAMNTKWNALSFVPGLVGGHCIGVDPYYFLYEAEKLGYHSQLILSGRKINDGMSRFVADAIVKQLVLAGHAVRQVKLVVLGITFKENTPDLRNTRVVDLIRVLKEYGIESIVVDPLADQEETKRLYGISLMPLGSVSEADCLVFAVAHKAFRNLDLDGVIGLFGSGPVNSKVLIDVKHIFERERIEGAGYRYWSL